MKSKNELAIALSKLNSFDSPKMESEQYNTDSEIAAEVLWTAFMDGDIKNRTIADLGAGTGILGISCLLLGAKKVYFVEQDKDVIQTLKNNIERNPRAVIVNKDISGFTQKVDVVIQNPPFGTKRKHADREFLVKAFSLAKTIYSFHKTSTRRFIESIAKDHQFQITGVFEFSFSLKKTMDFHTKKTRKIQVSCYRMEKSL